MKVEMPAPSAAGRLAGARISPEQSRSAQQRRVRTAYSAMSAPAISRAPRIATRGSTGRPPARRAAARAEGSVWPTAGRVEAWVRAALRFSDTQRGVPLKERRNVN